MSSWSDGFGGEVQLGVVGVGVELKSVVAEDLTKWEDVYDEEEGTEYRALGDTVGNWGGGGVAVIDGDELLSIGEVGCQPGKGSTG